jgi:hypothetical protein
VRFLNSQVYTTQAREKRCGKDDVTCLDGSKCIHKLELCDIHKDCDDGSDEKAYFCRGLRNSSYQIEKSFPLCLNYSKLKLKDSLLLEYLEVHFLNLIAQLCPTMIPAIQQINVYKD